MHRLSVLVLCISLFCLAGCQIFPPLNSREHPRIGVICLFDDTVQISNISSFFAFPKRESIQLPGLHDEFSKAVIDNLNSHGFKASLIPISAEDFWEKSNSRDGDYGAMINAIRAYRDAGKIDVSAFDAIVLIGPTEGSGERHFLGRDGDSITIFHNDQHPSDFGMSVMGTGCSYDLKTLQSAGFVGFGSSMQTLVIPDIKSLDDIRNKGNSTHLLQAVIPELKPWAESILSLSR